MARFPGTRPAARGLRQGGIEDPERRARARLADGPAEETPKGTRKRAPGHERGRQEVVRDGKVPALAGRGRGAGPTAASRRKRREEAGVAGRAPPAYAANTRLVETASRGVTSSTAGGSPRGRGNGSTNSPRPVTRAAPPARKNGTSEPRRGQGADASGGERGAPRLERRVHRRRRVAAAAAQARRDGDALGQPRRQGRRRPGRRATRPGRRRGPQRSPAGPGCRAWRRAAGRLTAQRVASRRGGPADGGRR